MEDLSNLINQSQSIFVWVHLVNSVAVLFLRMQLIALHAEILLNEIMEKTDHFSQILCELIS